MESIKSMRVKARESRARGSVFDLFCEWLVLMSHFVRGPVGFSFVLIRMTEDTAVMSWLGPVKLGRWAGVVTACGRSCR